MTSINNQPLAAPLANHSHITDRHETKTTNSARPEPSAPAAHRSAKMYDETYLNMYNTIQQMKPPPTLEAMRAQVPDDKWNASLDRSKPFRELGRSYGLSLLLQTPMAQELGRKLKEQFEDFFPGRSDLSWASLGITALLTQGKHGDPGEIAGFDFDSSGTSSWDEMAANMFSRLKTHLIATGRATPELAEAATYALLWNSAPEYLLNFIPENVNRHSDTWEAVRKEISRMSDDDNQAPLGKFYDSILDKRDPQRVIDRQNEGV